MATKELLINPKLLNEIVARLDSLGFQIHFHAIGDAAIRSSLDSLEFALNKMEQETADTIFHTFSSFDPSDIKRFRT